MTTGDGSVPGMSSDEIRATVRAVLREVLPAGVKDRARAAAGVPAADQLTETVSMRNDSDLDALVRRVAQLCEDPAQRAALRDGRNRFRMAAGVATAARHSPAPQQQRPMPGSSIGKVVRVEQGAVTERRVKQAASEGARLVVGRKAVLTPLARERAQALGVVVEREH
jgi:hypothetical protein